MLRVKVNGSLFSFAVLIALAGCGGSNGGGTVTPPPGSGVSVAVSPTTASVLVAAPVKFTATVTGSSNTSVSWSVVESSGGSVVNTGEYLAPATAGTYHVRATSVADSSKVAEATVVVHDYEKAVHAAPTASDAYDHHTATLLQDGSVLLVGGTGHTTAIHKQSERYIPAQNRFQTGGAMATARMDHAASILPSGKVLITGGYDIFQPGTPFDPAFSSTEIYNPTTDQFEAGPNMNHPRRHHVTAMLKDSRVLVTGGIQLRGTGFGASPNVEIYDPNTNAFTATGRMNNGRWLHTATVLADGRVLIVGGRENNCRDLCASPSLGSAELYDPATGQFTYTGSLRVSRYGHSAALLQDGRVMIFGGETTEDIGGTEQIDTVELFDPATGQFTSWGVLNYGRSFHSLVQLNNGKYLLVGGNNDSGLPSPTTEIFDPVTKTSVMGPEMNDWRIRATAVRLMNGEVLIVGGDNSGGAVLPVDIFR